ncbi:MAG: DNA primase, partial [Candidatus Pacebacteria bacterium]|nr:DNA primase [Candidatus Paceibacterota bacterium]
MSDQVQLIKERLNIVDVIGQYVKLTKSGKNYKGLSPFRKEKTPSFYVSTDKGMYYDFSSGQGGDLFTFVQQMEGLDFAGALHMLAERAGVELKHENKGARDARERLYGVLEDACRYFEARLAEHPEALAYLHDRGLEDVTIRSFRIGFAPDGWEALGEYLAHEGYRQHELEEAGLVKKGDRGKLYDRFRSRIMFPIMDASGRVVAFSGRIFGEPAKDDKNAKYLNSPETPLFDKGRILYGYDKAKQFIRKYDFSILVEGQMDIVMSHQAGYTNTVAVSGTGLTEDHLTLLDRLSKKLVMAFDADRAGIASSGRAAVLALKRGMDVKVATVPIGKDPADCIKEDKEQWKEAVKNSTHIVDFSMQVVLREHRAEGGDERALVLKVRDTVLPFVARVVSGVDQAHFVRKIANQLGIPEDAVWQDVRTTEATIVHDETHVSTTVPERVVPTRPTVLMGRREGFERALAGFLFWQESLEPPVIAHEYLRTRVEELHVAL